jgi:pimeloyl-ACP methyl ester carboxylesterase
VSYATRMSAMTDTRDMTEMSAAVGMTPYVSAPTKIVSASNGVDYAYRDVGRENGVPLVMLHHFRGDLDLWDPAVIDELASSRRVITFNSRGVASSSGTTPSTFTEMAIDALAFIDALGFDKIDLLGFSIGSFVAQEITLIRPGVVRKIVLASSAPQGAPGMHGWKHEVIHALGRPDLPPEDYASVFFTGSQAGSEAAQALWNRLGSRSVDRDAYASMQTLQAQYDAVCTWGVPNHSLLQRVTAIDKPAFVASGDSDPMIPARYSYLLAGLLPDCRIKIYPDSAHGFLFQYHTEFAADVEAFLSAL